MQSRVLMFHLRAGVGQLQKTDPCAVHLAQWLVEESSVADAAAALHGPLATLASASDGSKPEPVMGLKAVLDQAVLPAPAVEAIENELASLGALHVQELLEADWHSLTAVSALKPLEKRRLFRALGC